MERMKPIRLSGHAREQLFFRGTTGEDVVEAIKTSQWWAAELGRLECRKDFTFENIWNKKYYKIKQVSPMFVEEDAEIVVITVYTYFF
ncbi:MAG: hypothetical protein E3K40_08765 [Candidatus Brocadia sp.]|nr:hypothetical protein [Candidatus Brocadia sp.]